MSLFPENVISQNPQQLTLRIRYHLWPLVLHSAINKDENIGSLRAQSGVTEGRDRAWTLSRYPARFQNWTLSWNAGVSTPPRHLDKTGGTPMCSEMMHGCPWATLEAWAADGLQKVSQLPRLSLEVNQKKEIWWSLTISLSISTCHRLYMPTTVPSTYDSSGGWNAETRRFTKSTQLGNSTIGILS